MYIKKDYSPMQFHLHKHSYDCFINIDVVLVIT